MTKLVKASVVAAVMFGAPIATAAAASANLSTHFCSTDTHTTWEIHMSNANGTGDATLSNSGTACSNTGPAGKDGADGAKGATGATGAKGDTGLTGAQGPAGPKGETGATGAVGATGAAGSAGAAGPVGPAGPKGDTGAAGATGAPGLIGLPGATGAAGAVGATGAPGADGTAGVKGDKGDAGKDGIDGINGLSPVVITAPATAAECANGGTDITVKSSAQAEGALSFDTVCNGSNGKDGSNGVNGTNGTDGKNGAAGKAGTTTVITKDANGNTVSTIDGLPSTGANSGEDWSLGGIALLAVLGGGTAVYLSTRRKNV